MDHAVNALDPLFLPRAGCDPTEEDIWRFYRNIHREGAIAGFTDEEHERLFRYDRGFGNMASRAAYYQQAFIRPFHRAVRAVFDRSRRPRVLDLCCGTGMQSLLFAILGAQVIAVDHDPAQLATLRKRQAVYASLCPDLTLESQVVDVTAPGSWPYEGAHEPFDAIYSHGGAGQLLSAQSLCARAVNALKPGGLLILKNGNPECWWLKAARIAPLDSARADYIRAAATNGFKVELAQGTTAFPRPLWIADLPLHKLDPLFRSITAFQLHLEYILRKAA